MRSSGEVGGGVRTRPRTADQFLVRQFAAEGSFEDNVVVAFVDVVKALLEGDVVPDLRPGVRATFIDDVVAALPAGVVAGWNTTVLPSAYSQW